MPRKYAVGHQAWFICQRCGQRGFYSQSVFDGNIANLRVHKECYEPKHPQENLRHVDDPIALWRPSPESFSQSDITTPVLTAVLSGGSNVELSWTEVFATYAVVYQYFIFRAITGQDFEQIATFEAAFDPFTGELTTPLTYMDMTAVFAQEYNYYVVGHPTESPDSPPSNVEMIFVAEEVTTTYPAGSFTWTKPGVFVSADVYVKGAGGGGSSGALRQSSTGSWGGAGGGGGGYSTASYLPADLPGSLTITVGTGGVGGASETGTGFGTGQVGTDGGGSSFGVLLTAGGGLRGTNGANPPGGAGGAGSTENGGAGGAGVFGGSGLVGTNRTDAPGGGGGAGGQIGTNMPFDGADGGSTAGAAGGAHGIAAPTGTNGGAGVSGTRSGSGGGGGGGGGTPFNPVMGIGGNGGNGTRGSGGGGGGGATYDGGGADPSHGMSGAGGAGGDGEVVVVVHYV